MEIGCIQGATRFLGAPKDWDKSKGHCGTLPVADVPSEIGNQMISAWLPSSQEIVALAQGAPIYLHIFGVVHPVVGLSVGVPPDDNERIVEPTLNAVLRVCQEAGIELSHTVASKIAFAAVVATHQAMSSENDTA